MQSTHFLLLLFLGISLFSKAQFDPIPASNGIDLFYLDEKGNTLGNETFLSINYFHDGLALVRTEEGYGYINRKAEFVIQPQYAYANHFENGVALVYQKDGKAQFINKSGNTLFSSSYAEVAHLKNNRSIVQTHSGKYGAIDKSGHLVVDTVFSWIDPFNGPMTRAQGENHMKKDEETGKKQLESTIIDTSGQIIVPYEKLYDFNSYQHGYFKARIPNPDKNSENTTANAVFNSQGEMQFYFSYDQAKMGLDAILSSGFITVSFYKVFWDKEKKRFIKTSDYSDGLIDMSGKIIVCDSLISGIGDFVDGRAFMRMDDWTYKLVDEELNTIPTGEITRTHDREFKNGYARVIMDDKEVLIDLNGKIVPGENVVKKVHDFVILKNGEDKYTLQYKGETMAEDISSYQVMDYERGIIACRKKVDDDDFFQIYISGNRLWQHELLVEEKPQKLNTTYMTRAFFYAGSEGAKSDLGGFGKSDNTPQKIARGRGPEKLLIKVDMRPGTTYGSDYEGFVVSVINNSGKTVYFGAQDSRLNMLIQAKDANGEWRDIQYQPQSWCGNSYHTLKLKSKEYWSFTAPLFEGSFQTKCRVRLKYKEKANSRESSILYSNEFDMSINPGQFWNKAGYSPRGIMDPYFE